VLPAGAVDVPTLLRHLARDEIDAAFSICPDR
jgi:hypothetical protein